MGKSSSAEFSVSLKKGTGANYLWSVSPKGAGTFKSPTDAKTTFEAGQVNSDTPIKISVAVTTAEYGPVIKTKDITILNRNGWARTWGGICVGSG
jgi:hypothetical protein